MNLFTNFTSIIKVLVKLKNLFEKLNEITSVVDPSGNDGEAATFGDINKKDNTDKDDSNNDVREGLNHAPQQSEVRQVVNENQLSDWSSNANLCNKGYRIILVWNMDVVNILVLSQSNQAMHMKILYKATNNVIFCLFIYACNLPSEHRQLWSDLGMHKYVVRGFPWVLMGDSNVALNLEDFFSGSSTLNSAMYDFEACVNKIEVMDINATGLHFTWNQKPKGGGGVLKKLDQIMGEKALDTNPADSILREEECVYVQAFNEAKLDEESLVPDVFVSYYEQFLGSSTDCNILNEEGLFSNKVSANIAFSMVRDVTNDEIKATMFDIGDDRAPVLDGYTFIFFKKGWIIVGNDICNAEVVSDNQSAFIPGRRISDNILITQELTHNYLRNRGSPRCAYKIDIQKAYDTVDWKFLENILIKFGFHNTMVKWIMACVLSTSFSLSISGN
nr:hypothetical protein [Tanacetum cinerariifolium]